MSYEPVTMRLTSRIVSQAMALLLKKSRPPRQCYA